ncbi:MAG: hypothetical protein JSV88_21035 [Candidatus Aminicenantes bacterium]|nr:MAG: hypothetical protein JSV88_21035 [Candidatus Aminicenantes bacterium]
MELNLTDDEIVELKKVLKEKHFKISGRRIKSQWNKIANSNQIFPIPQQRALLVQLLHNYDTTQKKVVIILEELNSSEIPVTFILGTLAEDWPGMSNSILGIVHHKKRNVLFIKGFTLDYENKTLGVVILAFQLKTQKEYREFIREKKEIIAEIRDAAQGSTSKYHLLDDEAIKFEIYDKIMKKIRELYHNSELTDVIEESGEVLKFISSRSREYLVERKIKDLAQLILNNYISQNMIRSGEAEEIIKIRNFETKNEELTGISFVCRESLFSIEDFLKTLDHIVPGHIIRHHKSYVTKDRVLVYRIEIVDRNGNPLDGKLIKSIEASMDKLIAISCNQKFTRFKSVGGIEHYARAIIPFLSEELKKTKLTQVFINADKKTEFSFDIKLIIVSYKSRKNRMHSLISRLSLVPGIDISSSIPPKIRANRVEINILKLKVNLSEFSSIKEIYESIKNIVKKLYGDIRDFDEGFRDIYIKILNQLLDKLKTVNAGLIRDIFFSIDELYKIEISPNLLLELIELCALAVDESKKISTDKILYKYKHILESHRSILIISYVNHKRLLSRLVHKLVGVDLYFTKIEWDQRSYLIMILSKNNNVVEDDFIEDLINTVSPAADCILSECI